MDEIIFKQDELVRGSQLYIMNTLKTLKELQDKEKEIKECLYNEMFKRDIKKIENDDLAITLVLPTARESLDSKRLREEMPDTYDKYCRISNVKGTIKITMKEKKDGVDN